MNCPNCGAPLADGARFCTNCGASIPEGFFNEQAKALNNNPQPQPFQQGGSQPFQQGGGQPFQQGSGQPFQQGGPQQFQQGPQSAPQPPRQPRPKRELDEKTKRMMAIGAGVAVVLIIVIAYFMLRTPTINLNKYIDVEFSGYDTLGTARVIDDDEKFEEDNEKTLAKRAKINLGYFYDTYSDLLWNELIVGHLDQSRGLSNGDTVTFEWDIDDDVIKDVLGVKLKHDDIEFTVSGLEPVETFDPFDGIDVMFEGTSPRGTATIIESDSLAIPSLYYKLDRSSDLSNGETVTVTVSSGSNADINDYCINNYGMVPSSTEKTFTVTGLEFYVESISDISPDALASMQAQAEDVYAANAAGRNDDTETFQGMTYLGSYLLTSKDPSGYGGTYNYYYLVYKAHFLDQFTGETGTFSGINDVYWYIRFENLKTNGLGNTTVDVMSYRSCFNNNDSVEFDSGESERIGWGTKKWSYKGYGSLDDLYRNAVTAYMENFSHEDQVQDVTTSITIQETTPAVDETAAGETVGAEINAEGESEAAETDATATETVAAETSSGTSADSLYYPGSIFPDSSTRLLTNAEIQALSDTDLRYAINEIYARHGYIFDNSTLRNHFLQMDWYHETLPASQWSESMYVGVEHENVDLMAAERERRGI